MLGFASPSLNEASRSWCHSGGRRGPWGHMEEHGPWDRNPFWPPDMSHGVGQKPTEESLPGMSCLISLMVFSEGKGGFESSGGRFLEAWHRCPAALQFSDRLDLWRSRPPLSPFYPSPRSYFITIL